MKLFSLFFLVLAFGFAAHSQVCNTPGQTPATAFPVCTSVTFQQNTVPICNNGSMPVPGCSGADYSDKNPYWYRFTCFQSGTLGFTITPNNAADDYDWQLFDITGNVPTAVYSNPGLVVTGNWSGSPGPTGASASGVNFIQCASAYNGNKPRFAKMPTLIAGHVYLLMISHFDDTQSGYSLAFGGGSAVITDPKIPALQEANAACDGTKIRVALNKEMKCNSLAANGSDFTLNIPGITIINAVTTNCNAGFSFTEMELTASAPLPPGTHTLSAQPGTDGNSVLDLCDQPIATGNNISFTVLPQQPTPFDSITPVQCSPNTVTLVFKKFMQCNSVAPNGSDFVITGPSVVTVAGAAGEACNYGLSRKITVTLAAPIQSGGVYSISLQQGTDGNTLLDECLKETVPATLTFVVADTVNANFSHTIFYNCDSNRVQYNHNGANGVNTWLWDFTNGNSSLQNPVRFYSREDSVTTTALVVSNGVCADTASIDIKFLNYLQASFNVSPFVCPDSAAIFNNTSIGNIVNYNWQFGNGNTSSVANPMPQFYTAQLSANYIATPKLIIQNDYGCYDTATQFIKVAFTCFIAVPKAFTPNGDGRNDYLYPLQAFNASNLEFKVFNRFGQLLFLGENMNQRWDGKIKGQPADAGTYVWYLKYYDVSLKTIIEQKGTTVLIR